MKLRWYVLGVMFAVVLAAITGGGAALAAAKLKPAPSAAGKKKPAPLVLPSWAPKNPSKKFLRAARVLKPIPAEAEPYSPMHLAAWEFFGSLSDKQIAAFQKRQQVSLPISGVKPDVRHFLKENVGAREVGGKLVYYTHDVYVEYKSLSPQQQQLFHNIVKAFAESVTDGDRDLLVVLYKCGAKKDLSNVEVGFSALGGHAVHLRWAAVVRTGAKTSQGGGGGYWVAQI